MLCACVIKLLSLVFAHVSAGVIYAEASIVNIERITSFINNSAVIDGGEVCN